MTGGARLGALLMTYGSPTSLNDVAAYMTRVRGGREPEPELVTEFRRRYQVIGGSPLVAITCAQAEALEVELGGAIPVAPGMRFSEPTIEQTLRDLASRGVTRVAGIILSPQYSPLIMGGYGRAVDAAREAIEADGGEPPEVVMAGAWHRESGFVAALAGRIGESLARVPKEERDAVPVLLTAHSLPRRVADQEPDYLAQLEETASAVAADAGLERARWTFCWQSAGHEPGEWMKPDFADLMPDLAAKGHRRVLVAPVQFLSDHLEILYDIDIGAREQAEAAGLGFSRIESLNTDPRFISALAAVVRRVG
ncbi:MAG: ferrochelatase [Chloroflexota bacterium]|nr:ferrochelatase [Chloroflexota bacterium]